jgi:Polymerase beta, Nucleotidyltransferase
MSDISPLQTHRQERADLLAWAVRLLEADKRIIAVWLHGSMGRGTQDDWSDIDLFIVVADEHMEVVAAESAAFVSRAGTLLLTVEAPQNAPPGGAYLLAMYPGTHGPHILDCSWQPRSQARRPSGTRLLFDRAGIPQAEPPTMLASDDRLATAKHQTAFFWMMVTIVGKYIARRESWEVLGLLRFVWAVVARVEWLVGERDAQPDYRDTPPFQPPVSAGEQLTALRGLVGEMLALESRVPVLREAVDSATPEQVLALLTNVEESIGG